MFTRRNLQLSIYFLPLHPLQNSNTGCSTVGSMPALGAGGRRFESGHPDHLEIK